MKLATVKNVCESAIVKTDKVTFELNDVEKHHVAQALEMIELLKRKALQAIKTRESEADFTSYRFSRSRGTVTVEVRQGMIG